MMRAGAWERGLNQQVIRGCPGIGRAKLLLEPVSWHHHTARQEPRPPEKRGFQRVEFPDTLSDSSGDPGAGLALTRHEWNDNDKGIALPFMRVLRQVNEESVTNVPWFR